MKKGFKGVYYRHQKGFLTLCVIAGCSEDESFVQIICNQRSYVASFPREQYVEGNGFHIGKCRFSDEGISLDIETESFTIRGGLSYGHLSPTKSDVMGPLRYLPLPCRHGITSMSHQVFGQMLLDGQWLNFDGGLGYIEWDRGSSFPKTYFWLHSNDSLQGNALTVACAGLPVGSKCLKGFFAVLKSPEEELRMATYLGGKVVLFSENQLMLKQGNYTMKITVPPGNGQALKAPQNGKMTRIIHEQAVCPMTMVLMDGQYEVMRMNSDRAAFEFA